jgi:hypothetical protein
MTAASEPTRRRQRTRSPRTEDTARRVAFSILVLLLLAGLLTAGRVVRHGGRPFPPAIQTAAGGLPTASLSSDQASGWACPGPLPAGKGSGGSAVEVVNSGGRSATADVTVAATSPSNLGGSVLAGWSENVTVAAHSAMTVPMRTNGPASNDAVSVVSGSSAIAVFETIAPGATGARGHAIFPAPLGSPCENGTSAASYIASGSTNNKSGIVVAVFDPTATEAVVGMTVSRGSSTTTPPALQGLTIKPYSVQTFKIGTWVVQQATVAVTVTASVGQVAVGASEAQSSAGSTGSALVIGAYRASTTWTVGAGFSVLGRTAGIRLYDPGSAAATVSILSPVSGGPSVNLTAGVPAGGVITVQVPVTIAPPKSPKAAPIAEGPIIIRSAQNVPIVVARIVSSPLAGGVKAVNYLAVTAQPAPIWVLPAAGRGGGVVVVANPGAASINVSLDGTKTSGGLKGLVGLTVPAGGRGTFTVPSSGYGSYFLASSQPFVAELTTFAFDGKVVPADANAVMGIPVAP